MSTALDTWKIGHGRLLCVTWSPDGTRLAVGDARGGVSLFTSMGRLLWRKVEHTDQTVRLVWRPDGRALASGQIIGGASALLLWDTDSGAVLLRRKGTTHTFTLAWAPDGRHLLWTHKQGCLQILDTRSGTVLRWMMHSGNQIWSGDWSRDGHLIASSSRDNTIRLWQPESGDCAQGLDGHTGSVADVRFSPDSTLLASSSDDKTVRIWDVHGGTCLRVLEGHEGYNRGLAWSPRGNLLASTSVDETVRLWNPDSGEQLVCWTDHTQETWDVAFSPDATRLASVSLDGSLKLWDVTAWLPKQPEPEPENHDLRIYLSRQAATVGRLLPVPPWVPEHLPGWTGECLGVLKYKKRGKTNSTAVAFSLDNRILFTGGNNGELRAWDLRNSAVPWRNKKAHNDSITSLVLSPDGRALASGSDDGAIVLWNPNTGECLHRWQADKENIEFVTWSPNGGILASGNKETVALWEPDSGNCLRSWQANEMYCWQIDERRRWQAHYGQVWSVAWSPDGQVLALGRGDYFKHGSIDGYDNTIALWDVDSGDCLRRWQAATHYGGYVQLAVAWSPDGRVLASGDSDNTIALWNPDNGNCLRRWQGHENMVYSVAWSPDGCILASGSDDGTIALWNPNTGEEQSRFTMSKDQSSKVRHLSWAGDGAFLAASYKKNRFALWDTRRFMPQATAAKKNEADTARKIPPLPLSLRHLPLALAHLHRLQIHPPLNLLRDVLALLGGEDLKDLAELAKPLAPLIKINWPPAARIGLAAFVLRGYNCQEEWRPPTLLTSAQLRRQLIHALAGDEKPAEPAPFSLIRLLEQAQVIDETLVGLLKLLGPDAVAADPGLPLYFVHRLPRINPHIQLNRRLLSLVPDLRESGQAQQRLPGGERSGLSLRGELPHLLPSQLLLPRALLHSRYLRGELL
ncbi:MAG: hypothetical protein GY862_12085, partial [Gammaproteobacteria bacterium]|nr:hypothetical protein [Gammaproteobacteria bacterium]